jgi:FKBP-type peptidyl-prolyl cis-trans isomerase 2
MVNERIKINMNKIKYLFLAVLSFGITACSTGPKIESGSIVKVDYKGTLQDGTVFDTTEGKQPLAFMVGAGQVIPAFEEKVTQLAIGQTKKFTIKSVDAYGETDENKVVKLPRDGRFESVELKEGVVIFANNKTPEGKELQTPMKVVAFDDKEVTLDYNHPLAGKDLTFEVTVVEVNEPKAKVSADTKANNNQKQKNPAS